MEHKKPITRQKGINTIVLGLAMGAFKDADHFAATCEALNVALRASGQVPITPADIEEGLKRVDEIYAETIAEHKEEMGCDGNCSSCDKHHKPSSGSSSLN